MRLIDADALAARYMSAPPDYYHTSHIVGEITSAPTVKMQGWISVKDRLPEEGTWVLVWEKQGFAYTDELTSGGWKIGADNGAIITHWMPLPEPPEEVSADA